MHCSVDVVIYVAGVMQSVEWTCYTQNVVLYVAEKRILCPLQISRTVSTQFPRWLFFFGGNADFVAVCDRAAFEQLAWESWSKDKSEHSGQRMKHFL